ncbi:hypothetical protein AGOR_G00114550 [Albula goreensis]|uniref:Protrudin n=1 Tax=Albula goreensis TaxID=1534307 RepID=A0A8T3DJ16_9TELE|nr:hypothetical protein AGOR_G00114550 [Albula goreensis]
MFVHLYLGVDKTVKVFQSEKNTPCIKSIPSSEDFYASVVKVGRTGCQEMPQSLVNSGHPLLSSPVEDGESEVPDSPRDLTPDLFMLARTYRKLVANLESIGFVWKVEKYLLGWKMPIVSLLCCVLLNTLFLTVSEETCFFLGPLCVFILATVGCLNGRSRRKTMEALQGQSHSAVTREEVALEMKVLLRDLEQMLSQASVTVRSAYIVLCWERSFDSALFYGGLLTELGLLYSAPLSYALVVINSTLFLWNRHFFRVVRNMLFWRRPKPTEGQPKKLEQASDPPSTEDQDLSWGNMETEELDYEFKDAIEDGNDDDDDDNPWMARRGALVGEIPSIQQKGHKNARRMLRLHSGDCSRCHMSFSVLKKKRNCANCGSSFCTRCCSNKFPKSCLDPTAPEDLNETVMICTLCSVSLSKQE